MISVDVRCQVVGVVEISINGINDLQPACMAFCMLSYVGERRGEGGSSLQTDEPTEPDRRPAPLTLWEADMATETLVLSRNHTGWNVDFRDSFEASEIVRLFGTTILPTPFTASASLETVLRNVQAQNPSARIIVR